MLKSKQVPLEFQTKVKKYKKLHKIKPKVTISTISTLERGFLFCNLAPINLTVKQYLSVLKIVKPSIKDSSKKTRVRLYAKIDLILTRKPKDIRMGRGKGVPTERVAPLKGGQSVFKLRGIKKFNYDNIYKKVLPKFSSKAKNINLKW